MVIGCLAWRQIDGLAKRHNRVIVAFEHVELDAEAIEGLGGTGVELDGFLQMGDRLLVFVEVGQRFGESEMELEAFGAQRLGFFEGLERDGAGVHAQVDEAQLEPGLGIVGPKFDRLFQRQQRLLGAAAGAELGADVFEDLRFIARIQGEQLIVDGYRPRHDRVRDS